MNAHLFAYGTLMTAASGALGRPQRERLRREAASLGVATTAARLFDLGRYPGLVLSTAAGDVVHGEVFELADPATSFAWLDAYEGITPGTADPQYERVERPVLLADGRRIAAWVYVYRHDLSAARPVVDGRWRARCS